MLSSIPIHCAIASNQKFISDKFNTDGTCAVCQGRANRLLCLSIRLHGARCCQNSYRHFRLRKNSGARPSPAKGKVCIASRGHICTCILTPHVVEDCIGTLSPGSLLVDGQLHNVGLPQKLFAAHVCLQVCK